jgi:CRP-like cAMP-binding protein
VELEQTAFFEGLEADIIARIREASTIQTYLGTEYVYREGDPARDFYILRDGKVLLTCTTTRKPGAAIRIAQVDPGETFGWAALAGQDLQNTQAQALDDSSAYAIPSRELEEILRDHPAAGCEILLRLFQRVQARLQETRNELRWLTGSTRSG